METASSPPEDGPTSSSRGVRASATGDGELAQGILLADVEGLGLEANGDLAR